MTGKHVRTITLVATITVGLANIAAAADPALERAAAALRVNDLKSVRYAGDGIGWTFGQAYKPGEPWPKIRLNSWARTINYETGAMRQEAATRATESEQYEPCRQFGDAESAGRPDSAVARARRPPGGSIRGGRHQVAAVRPSLVILGEATSAHVNDGGDLRSSA